LSSSFRPGDVLAQLLLDRVVGVVLDDLQHLVLGHVRAGSGSFTATFTSNWRALADDALHDVRVDGQHASSVLRGTLAAAPQHAVRSGPRRHFAGGQHPATR
jgi:hypothetical protein